MDLEVFGRHALLFDDDSMAAFVNSSAALVDWNDLLIDRYDVRHLLSSLPPRPKRRRTNSDDPDLESELEHERYLDLPAGSQSPSQDQNDLNDVSEPTNAGSFNAVPFSYGTTSESNDQKNADTESVFHPPFPVPESLLFNLPLTEKLHQIITRTAMFVGKHGGQSEIVLRVKQGGNPTFGFLMPDHRLHPYFRYLVEHQELLMGKSFEEDKKNEGGQVSGALSLLGSIYGTGEDEDIKDESAMDSKINESDEGDKDVKAAVSIGTEGLEGKTKLAAEGYAVSKHHLLVKDKVSIIKGNPSVSTVNIGDTNKTKKEDDSPEKIPTSADKLQSSVAQTQPKFELPIVEPPADMKRVIDKIVEFILRNGREFEAILAAQDVKYGRFPFLLPASLYHAYYRKVLREAEESKSSGEGKISEKRDKNQDKRADIAKEEDKPADGSDLPNDFAKKEKFKMVIGKSKKDEPPKPVQPQIGVTIDADAAAAIIQAARRGIKNPNLGILSSNSLNETSSQGLGSDSSQPSSMTKNIGQMSGQSFCGPGAKSIAKTAALAAANEADSSEAGLSKEQKLKAERLKRAKMFMAMLKSGAEPSKAEPARCLSIEPPDSGLSGSGANAVESAVREREGSSVPFEAEKKCPDNDNNERRSKRNYRSRSQRDEDDEKDEEDKSRGEDTEEIRNNEKDSSGKRHSDHSRDGHKHKRRRSSKDTRSRDKHRHDTSDDEHHKRSRHRHKHGKSSRKHELDDSSDNEHGQRHKSSKHTHADSSDDEREHHRRHRSSRHNNKHGDSSDDEHRRQRRSSKHNKHKDSSDDEHRHKSSRCRKKEKIAVDEEIVSKSKVTDNREDSCESGKPNHEHKGPLSGQNEATQVSEELRAKIRAMLTGTL
ncbi:PREDICTED: protein suppressor of white apricot isoform X2 [Tarenaya hassleriana]|nr:PREDICTED: protein suppressor of white apricot isoform X2 [Tarenaya hassleriana]